MCLGLGNMIFVQTRTSTDVEDVQQMAIHLGEKNRQGGQELDRIFMLRKQRESDTAKVGWEFDIYIYLARSK